MVFRPLKFRRIGLLAAASVMLATGSAQAKIADLHPMGADRVKTHYSVIDRAIHHPQRFIGYTDQSDLVAALAFYSMRDFQPVWTDGGKLTRKGITLIRTLADAGRFGLDPAEYRVDFPATPDRSDWAVADLKLSLAVVKYARHAQMGRIDPASISRNIDHRPEALDIFAVLDQVASQPSPRSALLAFHPQHAQYWALASEMDRMETALTAEKPEIVIPAGQTLKLGREDDRIALLRQRLSVAPGETPSVFDETLKAAVMTFQDEAGLVADGIVGPRTLARLNGEADEIDRRALLAVNMERWRWMPRDLGEKHVFVNIPHYRVAVLKEGDEIYNGRVVVGKPKHMTPVFSDELEHIVVNPYWNVPASIARNEILPRLRSNPAYGYKYEVISSSGRAVDPTAVNWSEVSGSNLRYRFRQPPGARNALGRIKFLFPNHHAVYLHDTPARSLFSRTNRAFSHGCIRLHEPMAFADAVFSQEPKWNAKRVKRMVGGKESWINLKVHIPVHLGYFTAWAGPDGKISYRRDIYGHDRRMIADLTGA